MDIATVNRPARSRPAATMIPDLSPMLRVDDLAGVLNCSRREVERMRAAGRVPKPDLYVGKRSPRWRAATVTKWIGGNAGK